MNRMNSITTEKIESRFNVLRTFLAIVIALAFAFLLIYSVSDTPWEDFLTLLIGPLRNSGSMITIISKMVPLTFTAIAISLVYSANQINIGVEGAFFAGSVAATAIAIIPNIPSIIHIPLTMIFAALIGSLVMVIPAILYVKYSSVTIVTSLMLNYVALHLGLYIILNPLRDPSAGFEGSYSFAESAILPRLFNPRLTIGIIIAILVVIFAYFLLNKTTFGYKVLSVGNNKNFAKYSGINVSKTIVYISLISGAVAGLGGSVELLGNYNRFMYSGFTNHGWDGMMISVMCWNNPKFIPLGVLFIAYLQTSADTLNFTSSIPPEVIEIVQAIIIIFVAANQFLKGWEHRTIVKNTTAQLIGEDGQ